MSNIKVNTINDASGGSAAVLYGVASPPNSMGFRNRIINGDMRIDMRNAGASVTPIDGQYTLDRWSYNADQPSKGTIQQNAGAVTPPAGFSNYLGFTSTSAYSVGAAELFALRTVIEGFNFADMAFGSTSSSSITLSFLVRSSLTGTFGGAVENNGGSRSYVFSYTISAANTWEQKTITIPGDTTGTWLTTNGVGLTIRFALGLGANNQTTPGSWSGTRKFGPTGSTSVVGTNGATFYITGVQLEAGTVATPFERRDYGRELMMCQRYYANLIPDANPSPAYFGMGSTYAAAYIYKDLILPVQMRTAPTASITVTSKPNLNSVAAIPRASNRVEVQCTSTGAVTDSYFYASVFNVSAEL